MTEDEVRKFDEMTTDITRTFPNLLWGLYSSLVDEGFSEPQAFELTRDYLKSISGGKL